MTTPLDSEKAEASPAKLALAAKYYHEFYHQCFWHCRPDLLITSDNLAFVLRGLRSNGGRKGLEAAARLLDPERTDG
jgi:hypothetical protein